MGEDWEEEEYSDWIVELILSWKWLVEAGVMRSLIEVIYESTGQKGRLFQKFSTSEPLGDRVYEMRGGGQYLILESKCKQQDGMILVGGDLQS